MAVNYLPFIRREVANLVGGARSYIRLPIFGAGAGKRVILGDMDVWGSWPSLSANPVLMRIGILGYKYFTEDFIKLSAYQNGHRPLCMTWKFPRPYRILPGQRMRATYIQGDDWTSYSSGYCRFAAVMFNGVREKDGRPIMLYDSFDCGLGTNPNPGATGEISLDKEAMYCPSDSSVLLYSVTFPDWKKLNSNGNGSFKPRVQIYGPDDRKWLEWSEQPAATGSAFTDRRLIEPAVTKIILGESNGWILNPSQILTADFISTDTTASGIVYFTLRGCVEVES